MTRQVYNESIPATNSKLAKTTCPEGRRTAIYARYSSRFQHSIEDQVRACREYAHMHDLIVRDEHIFSDRATTGKTHNRKGLKCLKEAMKRDEVDVVICFATNRLYRKVYKALQFVEEEVIDRRKRCIFVVQQVDTADEGFWKQLLNFSALLDEWQCQMGVDFIRSAHEGLLVQGYVHGTITFGYTGVEVKGSETRQGKPRRRLAIDDTTAAWVKKVFHWFLNEDMGYTAIARRLNREAAPRPVCAERWSPAVVKRLLENLRYTGDWAYGRTEVVWQNKAGYGRQFKRDQPRREHRIEDLRIIDDATFYAAQTKIKAQPRGRGGGRKRKGQPHRDTPHLLGGLLWCPKHDVAFQVGGSHGDLMYCHRCKKEDPEQCELYSYVNRELAERLVCQRLAALIREDQDMVDQVIRACKRKLEKAGQPDEHEIAQLQKQRDTLANRIRYNRENPGDTEQDRQESAAILSKLSAQRASIDARLEERMRTGPKIEVPDPQELRKHLDSLADIFQQAIESDSPVSGRIRRIVHSVCGERIAMSQQGQRQAKQGWLRGVFHVQLLNLLPSPVPHTGADGPMITIDFRELAPFEQIADKVKQMADQGLLFKQIAHKLKVGRNLVTKAWAHWHDSRGLAKPDARQRRSHLDTKHMEPPLYQQVADQVMRLCDTGLLYQDVADQLKIDRNTVTAAVEHWHKSRGLPVPDGRTRRKALKRQREPLAPDAA